LMYRTVMPTIIRMMNVTTRILLFSRLDKNLLLAGLNFWQQQLVTLSKIDNLAINFNQLWQGANCNVAFLSYLAKQYSDPYLPPSASLNQRRQIIKDSFTTHQIFGTKKALAAAVAPFTRLSRLDEWFTTGGNPATFALELTITQNGLNAASLTELDILPTLKGGYFYRVR